MSKSIKQIKAMINLDMVGRLKDNLLQVGGTGTAAQFDQIIRKADEGSPIHVKSVWNNGIAPSDNTTFVLKEIPVLMLFTGLHEDYHRPTDVASKINVEGEQRIIDIDLRIVVEISRQKELKFVKVAGGGPSTRAMDPSLRSGGASLGVVPDYPGLDSGGVRITGTSPGTAAEKAGLQAGDILVGFDGKGL